ncbi:MAG: MBL fold metallo-hydrolase [Leucobacter sp.]
MNTQSTSENQLGALRRGELPPIEEVRPGIHAIALDMPGMQPPYAFSYAILAGGRSHNVHLIDAGLSTDENWAALDDALASLDRRIEDVASVTVTHMHHDHLGLAARIREASGAVVRMHAREAEAIERRATFGVSEDPHATLARWGVPESEHQGLLGSAATAADSGAEGETSIEVDERVEDGDVLQLGEYEARAIHTPGHTTGHLCLAIESENVVFTGDHVLPVINPGIALGGERSADPLGEYYASLNKLSKYADAEVLPGHGFRFATLGERCAEIRAHHEKRTREVAAVLAADPSLPVWEIASRVTWSYGWEALTGVSLLSALAQTEMHLARVNASDGSVI